MNVSEVHSIMSSCNVRDSSRKYPPAIPNGSWSVVEVARIFELNEKCDVFADRDREILHGGSRGHYLAVDLDGQVSFFD